MELKEYFQIIKKNIKIFFLVVILTIIGSFSYFYLQPVSFETSLILNITRLGTQSTQDYQYDDFYRLQADERFAQTVSQWLKSPRIVADILNKAGIDTKNFTLDNLSEIISAEKKSSQIVSVSFIFSNQELAKKMSIEIIKTVSQNTDKLNEEQKQMNWFKILAEDSIIVESRPNYKIVFLASFLAGIFLAFWMVMLKHYFE